MTDHDDTLLLVEDDDLVRQTLGAILRDEGYEVVEAANGKEALDRLRSGVRPCLIVLDVMMPVMNGWEFCQARDRDPSLARIPVLIVSADGTARERARAMGAVDFLPKPLDLNRLLRAVVHVCPGGAVPAN